MVVAIAAAPAASHASHPQPVPAVLALVDAVAKPRAMLAMACITIPAALADGSSIEAKASPMLDTALAAI